MAGVMYGRGYSAGNYLSLSNRSCKSFLYSDFKVSFRKLTSIKSNQACLARSIFLKIFCCCFSSSLQVVKAAIKSSRLIFFFLPFRVSARSSSSAGFTSAVATMSYPGANKCRLCEPRMREKFFRCISALPVRKENRPAIIPYGRVDLISSFFQQFPVTSLPESSHQKMGTTHCW